MLYKLVLLKFYYLVLKEFLFYLNLIGTLLYISTLHLSLCLIIIFIKKNLINKTKIKNKMSTFTRTR